MRALLLERCQAGKVTTRSISLVLEHDAMHLETLCYMLAQVSCTARQASRFMQGRCVAASPAATCESFAAGCRVRQTVEPSRVTESLLLIAA